MSSASMWNLIFLVIAIIGLFFGVPETRRWRKLTGRLRFYWTVASATRISLRIHRIESKLEFIRRNDPVEYLRNVFPHVFGILTLIATGMLMQLARFPVSGTSTQALNPSSPTMSRLDIFTARLAHVSSPLLFLAAEIYSLTVFNSLRSLMRTFRADQIKRLEKELALLKDAFNARIKRGAPPDQPPSKVNLAM